MGEGGSTIFDSLGQIVADAVNGALQWVLDLLSTSNSATGVGQDWFGSQYDMMLAMGAWVLLPLVVLSVIQSIAKSSMEQLIKSVIFYPLIATVGAVVAIEIVRLLIVITDDLSSLFNNSASSQIDEFFERVKGGFSITAPQVVDGSSALSDPNGFGAAAANLETGARTLFVILIGLGILAASLMTVVILALRDASIYIATLFLPIGFATLVWPASAKWFRTISEFLLAMILSKLVIVATIALGVSAAVAAAGPGDIAPTVDLDGSAIAAGATMTGDDTFEWIYLSLFALTVLIFAVWSPNATSRMISLALDSAAGAFAQNSGRPTFYRWVMAADRWTKLYKSFGEVAGQKKAYKAAKDKVAGQTVPNERLVDMGHGGKLGASNYDHTLSREELSVVTTGAMDAATGGARTAAQVRADLFAMSRSTSNAGDVAMAHEILEAYKSGGRVTYNMADSWVGTETRRGTGASATTYKDIVVVLSPSDAAGNTRNAINPSDVSSQVTSARTYLNSTPAATADRIRVKGGLDANRSPQEAQMVQTVNNVIKNMANSDPTASGSSPRRKYVHERTNLSQSRPAYIHPSVDFDPTT